MASLAKQAAEAVMSNVNAGSNEVWHSQKFQCSDNGAPSGHWAYALFCPLCASAQAKSQSDGSHPLFNFFCFPWPATYSMVRYNYGIKGECGDDMLWTLFCPPCMIRQAYSESATRGMVQGGKYGALSDEWHYGLTDAGCQEMLLAIFCPCVVSSKIRQVIHSNSNTWFNMMCIIPCSMYGTVRHTYGLRSEFPNPVCEDCALGVFCYPCALARAAKEAPYQRTTGKVNSAIESAHKKAEEMKSTLKQGVLSKVPGLK